MRSAMQPELKYRRSWQAPTFALRQLVLLSCFLTALCDPAFAVTGNTSSAASEARRNLAAQALSFRTLAVLKPTLIARKIAPIAQQAFDVELEAVVIQLWFSNANIIGNWPDGDKPSALYYNPLNEEYAFARWRLVNNRRYELVDFCYLLAGSQTGGADPRLPQWLVSDEPITQLRANSKRNILRPATMDKAPIRLDSFSCGGSAPLSTSTTSIRQVVFLNNVIAAAEQGLATLDQLVDAEWIADQPSLRNVFGGSVTEFQQLASELRLDFFTRSGAVGQALYSLRQDGRFFVLVEVDFSKGPLLRHVATFDLLGSG